jgi:hypothetical protein
MVVPLVLLTGCSYGYDLVASFHNGRLLIDVDRTSDRQPSCARRVEISAEGERESTWLESVHHDDNCANRFPLKYGDRLAGRHQLDSGDVGPKALRRGVVYTVSATTGATGYGSGRFIIEANGTVENLPNSLTSMDVGNGN